MVRDAGFRRTKQRTGQEKVCQTLVGTHRNKGDGEHVDRPVDKAAEEAVVDAALEQLHLDHVEHGNRVHLEGAQHVDEHCGGRRGSGQAIMFKAVWCRERISREPRLVYKLRVCGPPEEIKTFSQLRLNF